MLNKVNLQPSHLFLDIYPIEIKPLADIVKILQEDIQATGVSTFGAYNVSFDLDALMQTVNFIYPDTFKMIYRQTNNGKYAPDTTKFCQKYIFRKKQGRKELKHS